MLGLLYASRNEVRFGAWRWQNHHHGEGSPSAYLERVRKHGVVRFPRWWPSKSLRVTCEKGGW